MKYILLLTALLTGCSSCQTSQKPKSQSAADYGLEEICIDNVTYLYGTSRLTPKLDRRGRPVGCDVSPVLQQVEPSGMVVK